MILDFAYNGVLYYRGAGWDGFGSNSAGMFGRVGYRTLQGSYGLFGGGFHIKQGTRR